MESIRALIGLKPKDPTSDEQVFVEELGELFKPHVHAVVEELEAENVSVEAYPSDEAFLEEIHKRLLVRFFAFANNDPALGKFMFPMMMHLRKTRAMRQKITPA